MIKYKNDYEKMDNLVISIYQDYGFSSFPIDVFELCKKLGIKLIEYSSFEDDIIKLLMSLSKDGFFIYLSNEPVIIYNDINVRIERIRMTIAHEIKHYLCEDTENDEKSEKTADHFARFLLCPTPYLIFKNINDVIEIKNTFQISYNAATNALNAAERRKVYYGNKIFEYEQLLINLFI